MSNDNIIAVLDAFPLDGDEEDLRLRLSSYVSKDLRSACSSLRIQPQGKARSSLNNKGGYVALLCEYWQARQQGAVIADGPTKPNATPLTARRTKHCFFRLANVIFSERFADRLHEMDGNPSRHALDNGAVNAYSCFWQDVEAAFASTNVEYDWLVQDRLQYEGIDPRSAPPHNAEKLRELWRKSTGSYTTALTNSRQSGTHTSDFFDFCGGRLDALYLHDWLEHRPAMLAMVERMLPKRARVDTLTDDGAASSNASSDRDTSTPAKKRIKVLDRISGILEAQQTAQACSVMSSSLEKARVVKEWASAIEILARVGHDSTGSVQAITAAVDSIVRVAATELNHDVQRSGDENQQESL